MRPLLHPVQRVDAENRRYGRTTETADRRHRSEVDKSVPIHCRRAEDLAAGVERLRPGEGSGISVVADGVELSVERADVDDAVDSDDRGRLNLSVRRERPLYRTIRVERVEVTVVRTDIDRVVCADRRRRQLDRRTERRGPTRTICRVGNESGTNRSQTRVLCVSVEFRPRRQSKTSADHVDGRMSRRGHTRLGVPGGHGRRADDRADKARRISGRADRTYSGVAPRPLNL